jgi:hypothetical protein
MCSPRRGFLKETKKKHIKKLNLHFIFKWSCFGFCAASFYCTIQVAGGTTVPPVWAQEILPWDSEMPGIS